MKKFLKSLLSLSLAFALIFTLASCGGGSTGDETKKSDGKAEPAKYHIGIVTGTQSQGEDEIRAAEAMVAKYGNAEEGGMIKHLTYPDNFAQEQEQVISIIAGLADDPDMKAIMVNQSIPGTAVAFQQIRDINPDIKLIAIEPQEEPQVIDPVADVVIDNDNYNRGYLMIDAAKRMGAKAFVHISFPRHMSMEKMQVRKAVMEATCKDLGLKFYSETAPDPLSDVGMAGAKQFIQEQMPAWVEKYGKDTAFFCTNDAQTEPLLQKVAELGAIFVEADLPSPLMGYPGAFGIDLKAEAGDWDAILKKVEDVVIEKGGSGRMGTWAKSYGYSTIDAATLLAINSIEGKMDVKSEDDLLKCLREVTDNTPWNYSVYVNRATGEKHENHFLLYEDTYVFGKGFLGMTDVKIPEKYQKITGSEEK